jgi:hypothetical protein
VVLLCSHRFFITSSFLFPVKNRTCQITYTNDRHPEQPVEIQQPEHWKVAPTDKKNVVKTEYALINVARYIDADRTVLRRGRDENTATEQGASIRRSIARNVSLVSFGNDPKKNRKIIATPAANTAKVIRQNGINQ